MRRPEHPTIQALRRGFIREYRSRLSFLRIRDRTRREGTDGLTLEFMLRDLAKRAGARGDPHGNAASWITANFPPAQRRALFIVLQEIEERIRWAPNVQAMRDGGPARRTTDGPSPRRQ
jgi:hypothetical protein